MFLLVFLFLPHLSKAFSSQGPYLPSSEYQTIGPFPQPLHNSTHLPLPIFKLGCCSPRNSHPYGTRVIILLPHNQTSDENVTIPNCEVFNSKDHPDRIDPIPINTDQNNNLTFLEGSKDDKLYYNIISPVTVDITPNCTILQLPFNRTTLKSKQFWVSFKTCVHRECEDREEEKKPTPIIIGVTLGFALFVILAAVAIFMIRRARKNKATAYSREIEDNSVYFGVPVFSYTELQDATHHFDSSQELGDGGFGTVYYGKLRDGREVAVKRLYEHNYKRVQQFMNEVEILTRLRHKNLVLLYGCTSRRSIELLLVYEYIANGTVANHLHGDRAKQSPLTWPIRMKIAMETASALVYLHASDIIHRDVKTNNILLDPNYCVKVADFGLSRLLPNDVTHVSTAPQGTPGYVDPEYHQCYQLTDKSDVYSFGVVLIELISSMPAIDISRSRDEISLANMAINRIQRCALDELIDPVLGSDSETERMTRSVAELAFRCLQFDSETRPTMSEVLEFLKGVQGEGGEDGGEMNSGKQQMPPPSPETEDAGLLKEVVMASPISVTAKWHSSGSGVTTPNTSVL